MTLLEAASSGVVQGVTEFLPVSSSGHLVLLHTLFGHQESELLFDLFLHLGTMAAVLILFRRKILLFLTTERKLFYFVILGSFPTALLGALFAKTLEKFFTQPHTVGWGFLMTALWLFLGERFRPKEGKGLSGWKAIAVGISQGIAITPGISRSGSTIATALLLGVEGSLAVEYSFLLSIPAVTGAFLYKTLSKGHAPFIFATFFGKEGIVVAIGTLTAMGFGIFAIKMISRLVAKRKLYFFSIYLVLLGIMTLLFFGKMP